VSVRLVIGGVAAMAVAQPALAQSMNAEVFHQRAVALHKKGPLALLSRGEIKALMNEGKASGERARAARFAAIKAGKTPRYCPPADVQGMGSDEFMKRLAAIPQAERRKIDMGEAMNRILAAKYPCK
jgi:hypothetical protein